MGTTANTPVPHFGQDGARNLTAWAARATAAINATQDVTGGFFGGPQPFGASIRQLERNVPGYDVVGSDLGQRVDARGRDVVLGFRQAPLRVRSRLQTRAGGTIVRKGGGILEVYREHGGEGAVDDKAAMIYLDDEDSPNLGRHHLIASWDGQFVVDKDRRVHANAGVFGQLWVGGLPVGAAGAATTDFSDSDFRVHDNGDATKRMGFEVSGVTAGATRLLTVPDASGTIALTSDLAALGDFADNLFHVHSSGDADRRGRFDASGISDATTRVYILPDVDGTLALTSDVVTSHGALSDLTTGDDHTQYLLLAGRFGGQDVTDTLRIDAVVSPDFLATGAVTGLGTVVVPLSFEPSDPADNGATGDGWRIPFLLETDSSVSQEAGVLQVEWTDATNGADSSAWSILGRKAGATAWAFSCDFDTQQVLICDETWDFSGPPGDGSLWVKLSGVWTPLAPGSEGDVLTISSGVPAWVAP